MLRLDKASNNAVEKRVTRTNVNTKFEVFDNTDLSFNLPQQIQISNMEENASAAPRRCFL
jgi:hypothetical protein